jgi:hypothetical protein
MSIPKSSLPRYANGGPIGVAGFATGGLVDQNAIFRLITAVTNPLQQIARAAAAAQKQQVVVDRTMAAPRARLTRTTEAYEDALRDRAAKRRDVARLRREAAATPGITQADIEYQRSLRQLAAINTRVTATSRAKAAAQADYNKVAAKSKAAIDKLKEAQAALVEQQRAVAESARQVSDTFSSAYMSKTTDVEDWLSLMRTGASDIGAFTAKIAQLRRSGLSETLVQQIIGMGAVAGSEVAAQIAAGGRGLVTQLNTASKGLQAAANNLGYLSATGVQRHADGGPVVGPGTGKSDSILSRLSNGEWVVPEEKVGPNLAWLKAITYGTPIPAMQPRTWMSPAGAAAGQSSGGGLKVVKAGDVVMHNPQFGSDPREAARIVLQRQADSLASMGLSVRL